MTRSSTTTRVERIYDDHASAWNGHEGLVERVLMGEGMRRALAAELRGDVLEIGTGTGATFPFLTDRPALSSLTAVDLSAGMLAEARNAAQRTDRNVRLAQMNAEALAFPDGTFDTVTTSLMLCTVPDPTRALSEMARVCKPNGRIVVLEVLCQVAAVDDSRSGPPVGLSPRPTDRPAGVGDGLPDRAGHVTVLRRFPSDRHAAPSREW